MNIGSLPYEYYGDNTRWFIATVIDNTPPPQLEGRVQLRIHGIHSPNVNDIPQQDLPWAQVVIPGTASGTSGLGNTPQIAPGATAFGLFADGSNSQLPIVIGTLPTIHYPTTIQAQGRDDPATNAFAYDILNNAIQGVEPRPGVQPCVTDPISDQNTARMTTCMFFLDNGFTLDQSAGITGVIDHMTKFDPLYGLDDASVLEKGLLKWPTTDGRFQSLLRYASSFEPARSHTCFNVQLTFILHELRTSKVIASGKLNQAKTIAGNARKYGGYNLEGDGTAVTFAKWYLSPATQQGLNGAALERAAHVAYEAVQRG